jgi:hypothetical protein
MRRQLTGWEFDICEIAFGAYLIARAQGADVTAIPDFPRRAFPLVAVFPVAMTFLTGDQKLNALRDYISWTPRSQLSSDANG